MANRDEGRPVRITAVSDVRLSDAAIRAWAVLLLDMVEREERQQAGAATRDTGQEPEAAES